MDSKAQNPSLSFPMAHLGANWLRTGRLEHAREQVKVLGENIPGRPKLLFATLWFKSSLPTTGMSRLLLREMVVVSDAVHCPLVAEYLP